MLQQTNAFVVPLHVQVTIGDQEEKKDEGEGGEKLSYPPVPAGTPPKAWEELQCFRMDLSKSQSHVSFYTGTCIS